MAQGMATDLVRDAVIVNPDAGPQVRGGLSGRMRTISGDRFSGESYDLSRRRIVYQFK